MDSNSGQALGTRPNRSSILLAHPKSKICRVDFGFWFLDSGFWIGLSLRSLFGSAQRGRLDLGFRILDDFGFRILLDVSFWILDFAIVAKVWSLHKIY